MELVVMMDSKSIVRKGVRVRVPPPALLREATTRVVTRVAAGASHLYFFVPMRIEKSLSALNDRLAKAREELRILEEQVLFQMDVVQDAEVRAVVAETPLADKDYQEARADRDRMLKERDRINREIAELQQEQDRLLDRMLGPRA